MPLKILYMGKLLSKASREIKKNITIQRDISIEGNNGGNYLKIKQLDDNRILIEYGDCCIHMGNHIITAEVFTSFLTSVCLINNSLNLATALKPYLRWDEEYNSKVLEPCHSVEKFENIEEYIDDSRKITSKKITPLTEYKHK